MSDIEDYLEAFSSKSTVELEDFIINTDGAYVAVADEEELLKSRAKVLSQTKGKAQYLKHQKEP